MNNEEYYHWFHSKHLISMKALVLFAILLVQIGPSRAQFPFKTCHRNKEINFNECLSRAVFDGIQVMRRALPQFDFPSLDALVLPTVDLDYNIDGEICHVSYRKFTVYGITDNIDDIQATMDFTNNILTVKIFESSLTCMSYYDLDGYLESRRIVGSGLGIMQKNRPIYTYTFYLELQGDHYKVVKSTNQINPLQIFQKMEEFNGTVTPVELNKMFNGDKNHFIMLDIERGFQPLLAEMSKMMVNKIFSSITAAELFGV